jgi:hypothetical protein
MKMKYKLTAYEFDIEFEGSSKDYIKIMSGITLNFHSEGKTK